MHNNTAATPLFDTACRAQVSVYRVHPPYTRVHTLRIPLGTPLGTADTYAASGARAAVRTEKDAPAMLFTLRFVMAGISRKLHRLICGRLRCILREMSYHQRLDQLRKRRLRSYVTPYSATDAVGEECRACPGPLNHRLDLTFLTVLYLLHRFSLYSRQRCHVTRFTPTRSSELPDSTPRKTDTFRYAPLFIFFRYALFMSFPLPHGLASVYRMA